jgi:hypothetical protein
MKTKKRSLDEIAADIRPLFRRTEVEEALLHRAKTTPRPKKKRGRLPNQHGRMSHMGAFFLRSMFGDCSVCRELVSNKTLKDPAVIYRRSEHSITFKCKVCGLQWMITLANMHRALAAIAQARRDCGKKEDYGISSIAAATKFATEREAKRRNTITRQTKRRVILLGNGEQSS